MSAREEAVGTIRSEHLSLETVVEALRRIIAEVATQHAEANFALFSAALYYFDDFPERCHHPKEDEFLFKALRRRTTALNEELDELQAEHIRSAHMVTYLNRALVHYQGGAPEGLQDFRAGVDAYATLLSGHMRREEQLLASAQEYLIEDDWVQIAEAFKANVDPLFCDQRSVDYGRLYSRIVTLLPAKLRRQMQYSSGAG